MFRNGRENVSKRLSFAGFDAELHQVLHFQSMRGLHPGEAIGDLCDLCFLRAGFGFGVVHLLETFSGIPLS